MSFDRALEETPLRRRSQQDARVTQEPGESLDAQTQRTMGQRFGHDFSSVRVHTDSRAAESARSQDALAYTSGSHVVFGEGQYAPETSDGQQLLAHELAHVVQQDDADSGGRQSAGTDTLENEADNAAGSVARGGPATIGHRANSPTMLKKDAPEPDPLHEIWTDPPDTGRGVGPNGTLDAEFDRKHGLLTLTMRVLFKKDWTGDPWPEGDDTKFDKFKTDFCSMVSKRWSAKHLLVAKKPCKDAVPRVAVLVRAVPVEYGEHAVVRVKNTSKEMGSLTEGRAAWLNVLDTKKSADIPQYAAEHEFGHLLGLPHIHCDDNAVECYGVTRDERADVMGEGSFVSPRDYEVFAKILTSIAHREYEVEPASALSSSIAPALGAAIGALSLGVAGALVGGLVGGPLGAFIGGAIGIIGGAIAGYFVGKDIASRESTPDVT